MTHKSRETRSRNKRRDERKKKDKKRLGGTVKKIENARTRMVAM